MIRTTELIYKHIDSTLSEGGSVPLESSQDRSMIYPVSGILISRDSQFVRYSYIRRKERVAESVCHIVICTRNSLRERTFTGNIFIGESSSRTEPEISEDDTFLREAYSCLLNGSSVTVDSFVRCRPFFGAGEKIYLRKAVNISQVAYHIINIFFNIGIYAGKAGYLRTGHNNGYIAS